MSWCIFSHTVRRGITEFCKVEDTIEILGLKHLLIYSSLRFMLNVIYVIVGIQFEERILGINQEKQGWWTTSELQDYIVTAVKEINYERVPTILSLFNDDDPICGWRSNCKLGGKKVALMFRPLFQHQIPKSAYAAKNITVVEKCLQMKTYNWKCIRTTYGSRPMLFRGGHGWELIRKIIKLQPDS
jgi:hypothetical protein